MANVVLQREVSQRSPLTTDAEIAFDRSPIPRSELQPVQRSTNHLDFRLLISFLEQLALDAQYVRDQSFLLDLKILFRTVFSAAGYRNAR